jgi:hypothetical protein
MTRTIPIFIASPSDVQEEREHTRIAIEKLSPRIFRLYGLSLVIVDWKEFAPEASGDRDDVFQFRLLESIEFESIFIGILHQRIGTPISDSTNLTGTESEFHYAINNRKRIQVLTYFKTIETVSEDQLLIARLKKHIMSEQLPFHTYSTSVEFSERIMLDILESIVHNISSSQIIKRKQYSEFFKFGCSRNNPQIISPPLIVYPPIHKHDSTGNQPSLPTYNWRERLLPNIVYEDFKAIQKIESALSIIGINDYSSVTTLYPKAKIENGNRIWLCLPRNEPAKEKLKGLGNRANFSFHCEYDNNKMQHRKIIWNYKGNSIIIESPLSNYMMKQRPKGRKKWDPKYGYIYAKDFAVLSRFEVKDRNSFKGRPFYYYFIAGIRGLGTWGAGWYINRFPDELAELKTDKKNRSIQIILEVEYCNYRVRDVKNVSFEKQEYFDLQNNMEYINSQIDLHCD